MAEHLEAEEDTVNYFEAAFEDGDPSLIAAALGDIARARGMTTIARSTGFGRDATILKVVKSLGIELRVQSRA